MKIVKRTRTLAALALLAAAGGAAVALGAKAVRDADATEASNAAKRSLGILSTDRNGFRYEFHAPSGAERLFDLGRDPRCLVDIAAANPDVVIECRRQLLESAGATSLDELRAPYAETIRRLEALGYF